MKLTKKTMLVATGISLIAGFGIGSLNPLRSTNANTENNYHDNTTYCNYHNRYKNLSYCYNQRGTHRVNSNNYRCSNGCW
ncbi:hypothetical protein OZX69_09315 [Lactobacillus sp. ESL0731]|uniref:hypothetical protein n=1 Tax=unclassified Lactobacillus TaxID=2620435 RepID=UPI0023F9181F|nr:MULTISPECIES: hypothetical protein [unclassified Lactobacillus]WEV51130.1 hypothetical protein OZX63_09315 [Lactobacillus sp. ESL0700]WEV62259.1 hypothetical protein OZX69_09315 [Lactobacillus sp. ESL0731]